MDENLLCTAGGGVGGGGGGGVGGVGGGITAGQGARAGAVMTDVDVKAKERMEEELKRLLIGTEPLDEEADQ